MLQMSISHRMCGEGCVTLLQVAAKCPMVISHPLLLRGHFSKHRNGEWSQVGRGMCDMRESDATVQDKLTCGFRVDF